MTFEQHVIDNDDDRFPGHQLIVGMQDGVEVWRSWAPEEIPIEARLNVDHPVAHDRRRKAPKGQTIRWKMPTPDVAEAAGADHAQILAAATGAGLDTTAKVGMRHGVKPGQPSPKEGT